MVSARLHRKRAFFLGVLGAALAISCFGILRIFAGTGPTVTTDSGLYIEFDTAIISGNGFQANQLLDVLVMRPDSSVVTGDGTQTPGWDVVQADAQGAFTYNYWLNWHDTDPLTGNYDVVVYKAGDPHTGLYELASTTFWFGNDAPDPVQSSAIVSVGSTFQVGGVDVARVTINGQWLWSTHGSTDCNFDRAGVGYGVDWGDPNQAGNHVTTLSAPVGSVDVGAAAANAYNPADNEVHPTSAEAGTSTVFNDPNVTPPTTTSKGVWRSGCGHDSNYTASGGNPTGAWGGVTVSGSVTTANISYAHFTCPNDPATWTTSDLTKCFGGSHVYTVSALEKGITICAIMYDIHGKDANTSTVNNGFAGGLPNNVSEITGGGSSHNGDNGAEKNSGTPLGNTCAPINVKNTPTPTNTPTNTPTFTNTPCPTAKVKITGGCGTPTNTPTFTNTPCPTTKVKITGGCGTPTNTPTFTNTPCPTTKVKITGGCGTPTNTATNTFTSTNTPSATLPGATDTGVTDTPTATATATRTTTPTVTPLGATATPGGDPSIQKIPALQNIFLTHQGAKMPPQTCLTGTDITQISEQLNVPIPDAPDPKNPSQPQQVGAFQFEIRYDSKLVCIEIQRGTAAAGMICTIRDSVNTPTLKGIAGIGCVTPGKDVFPNTHTPAGRHLATLIIRPQPEAYSQLRANQNNGITAQLLDQDCQLVDLQSIAIRLNSCDDADVTIRFLEGDIDADCRVSIFDTQSMAFRWGATKGTLLFSPSMDLEPSGHGVNGDGVLDINDLQFVYGRFGSTCSNPWPAQLPVNPKA